MGRSVARTHQARGSGGRRGLAERKPDGVGLVRADNEEENGRRAPQDRQRQRHPVDVRATDGDGVPSLFLEGGIVREERRCVPVGTHPEQHQLQADAAELGLVLVRGALRRQLAADAMLDAWRAL
jgi:hypothetical protein